MDKEQKELELKKLEIEKLKIKEGLFRALVIILLTVGAGLGTLVFRVYQKSFDFYFYGYLDLLFL